MYDPVRHMAFDLRVDPRIAPRPLFRASARRLAPRGSFGVLSEYWRAACAKQA
jgi:hypothetical protein